MKILYECYYCNKIFNENLIHIIKCAGFNEDNNTIFNGEKYICVKCFRELENE